MAYVYVERKMRNRFGRVIGGPDWTIEVFTDQALTTPAALKLDSSGSDARPNPGYANSGWQVLLTAEMDTADTFIDVEDTSEVVAGDVFQVVDGVFFTYLTVKAVTSSTRLTLEVAYGGAHTYPVGSTAGDPENLGDWAAWISDSTDVWVTVTKVGSSTPSIPKQWRIAAPPAVSYQKNDSTVASEPIIDVRAIFDVTDDAGNGRIIFSAQDWITDTDGATITMDLSQGSKHKVVLGGTGRTLAFTNPKAGGLYIIQIKQDGGGSRTITTYPSINWAGGAAPTLTPTGGKSDFIAVIYNGSTYDQVGLTQNV